MKNQEISPFLPRKSNRNTYSERGSVIFLVMIGVALFAALSFVMSKGFRTSETTINTEQAKLLASEVMSYGRLVKDAVKTLKIKGCTDQQISFQTDFTGSTYNNTSSPSDKKCHVFHPNGGGLKWLDPDEKLRSSGTQFYEGKYFIYGGTAWEGVGTTCTNPSCSELMMGLNFPTDSISRAVCEQINLSLGIKGTPKDSTWGGSPYTGAFTHDAFLGEETIGVELKGKQEACVYTASGGYSYSKVLLAR